MADDAVGITDYASLAELPPAALALFGQDAFSTRAWYASTVEAGLPAGAVPAFQVASRAGRVLAVLPMLRSAGTLSALTTPYTCLWQPLLLPGTPADTLAAIGRALAPGWRRSGVVRLDALPGQAAGVSAVLSGLRQAGLRCLGFDHFGNWHADVAGQNWAAYLAARPRRLRTAIQRQTRRLMDAPGAAFSLVRGAAGLDQAIADYETVHAASWKPAEPYPRFNATLMRACAADGSLRLGVLKLGQTPIAAQFWLVHEGWAGVLKLSYDEAYKSSAPGNVLSALVIQHLLVTDRVDELDFGRGDDEYKQHWTGERRQRVGVLVANPWSVQGAREIARQLAGPVKNFAKKGLASVEHRLELLRQVYRK